MTIEEEKRTRNKILPEFLPALDGMADTFLADLRSASPDREAIDFDRQYKQITADLHEYERVFNLAAKNREKLAVINAELTDEVNSVKGLGNQNLLTKRRREQAREQAVLADENKSIADFEQKLRDDFAMIIPNLIADKERRHEVADILRGISDDNLRESLLTQILHGLLSKREIKREEAQIVTDVPKAEIDARADEPAPIILSQHATDVQSQVDALSEKVGETIAEEGRSKAQEIVDRSRNGKYN